MLNQKISKPKKSWGHLGHFAPGHFFLGAQKNYIGSICVFRWWRSGAMIFSKTDGSCVFSIFFQGALRIMGPSKTDGFGSVFCKGSELDLQTTIRDLRSQGILRVVFPLPDLRKGIQLDACDVW